VVCTVKEFKHNTDTHLGMFAVIALMVGNVEQKYGASLNWHQNSSAFTPDNNVNDLQSVQLVACLTFAVGIVLAIMALCQFHIISVYLTDPLIGGFTTAAAFHVLWSQIPKMFALKLATRSGLFKLFYVRLLMDLTSPNLWLATMADSGEGHALQSQDSLKKNCFLGQIR
jgi:solute carrier family 26 (sodium-independent chloride/iodide transporter), member 4